MHRLQLTTLLTVIILNFALAASTFAQGGASGGRLPVPPSKPKPVDSARTPSTTSPAAVKTTNPRPRQSAAVDRIDGKWLTVGNDFGASELILTQNGTNISGLIRYADGRTGSLTGTLKGKRLHHTFTNSNGDTGSGWLELSWANFLGGSWRNDRVRDGSWVLRRIEGQWCLAGDRNQVRKVSHDASGNLTIITETGAQQTGSYGYQNSPFLNSPTGNIRGEPFYKSNRIDWADGTVWTWCGRLDTKN